jgi:hypothetical protein
MVDKKEKKYFEVFNLSENPFYSEPVPAVESNPKGFINREDYIKLIRQIIDDEKGFIIFIGDVGIGKTSLLKRAECFSRRKEFWVLNINVFENYGFNAFFNRFIEELKLVISEKKTKVDFEIEDLIKKLRSLDILDLKKEGMNEEVSVEHRVYLAPREERIKTLIDFLSKNLFPNINVIVIADDSDKLDNTKFKKFIEIVKCLPKNIIFLSTANHSQLTPEILSRISKIYDHYPSVESIKNERELKKYVEGRMENYSNNGKTKLKFGDEIYRLLFQRTCGNLREAFRYLRSLLRNLSSENKKEYFEILTDKLVKVIREDDMALMKSLQKQDFDILKILARYNKEDVYKIRDEFNKKMNSNQKETFIRDKLDSFCQMGLIHKQTKTGRGNKTIYEIPEILVKTLSIKI